MMSDDKTSEMLSWLKRRWLTARWLRSIANGIAATLVLVSILSSFASSIIAAGAIFEPKSVIAIVVAGLPAMCLIIFQQFPFHKWALFQNTRYVLYRETHFKLKYGTIDVATAVQEINNAGDAIAKAAEAMPYVNPKM
jgi:hypothetical protein